MDPSALIQQLQGFPAEALKNDPNARKEALSLSRRLTSSLQDPVSEATELVFSPFLPIAARMAVDLNLFKHIAESDKPISSKQLAEITGGEALLIWRLLRLLGSIGFVFGVAEDSWVPTPLTKAIATDAIAAGQRFVYDIIVSSAIKGPQFLRETHHKSPAEPTDGFVQYANQTKLPAFAHLATKPDRLRDFNTFMGNTMGARAYWTDWFPVNEKLLSDLDPTSKLLVDVAGGKGHDLQIFHEKFPNQKGLVLQELPQALSAVNDQILDPSVERMEYNFFTEQPVKGARAYFLHHILHDWSDKYCLQILKNLHAAMKPGYSKLLIHDLVLPDEHPSAYQCIFDMTMMTFNGGAERSQKQWTELLQEAGFEVVKFWIEDADADGIVEAVKKE